MPGKLHGVREYNRMVEKYGDTVVRQLEQVFISSAIQLAAYSRRIAPVSPKTGALGAKTRTDRKGSFMAMGPRSGRLRQSITHEVTIRGDKFIGAWGTNVKEAIFPEFGTRPHTILPKRKANLRFWSSPDQIVFSSRGIKHPGVRVGTPSSPRTSWKRKEVWGGNSFESMPYIRPAWSVLGPGVLRDIKKAGMAA